jgi:hypothetical protein
MIGQTHQKRMQSPLPLLSLPTSALATDSLDEPEGRALTAQEVGDFVYNAHVAVDPHIRDS